MGNFFVRRPVVAIVLAIVTVIAGLVAMMGLPIAQFPDIVPPEVKVNTTYTGADALTLEQSVSTPIEQKANGVDGMIYMRATSSNDGQLEIRVTFKPGTVPDMNNVLLQNRVSEATPGLPEDVKKFGVTVKKSMGMPFMIVSLASPGGSLNADFLGNYATINVIDELARVSGVGDVKKVGSSDYALRIWLRPDHLARLGLTVADITGAIRAQSTVNPAGLIGGEPAPKGQELTYSVRSQGRLTTPEEFGEIVVREDADGSIVRMRDVARVELGVETYTQLGRLNSNPAAIILIYQAPGSNSLALGKQIKETMERLSKEFPADMKHEISLDTTLPVTASIDEIMHTLLEAVLLVLLVVFLFLQSFRATLIPLLTVPVSLIGAFMLFPALGFSINTLSLFGMVLAIGLVVDDAIVVVEAVEHHIEHGLSPRDATVQAMKEVSGPVIAIALVLSGVFIPVAFLGGITGSMYKQFALTIALSMIFSAINALTLSPALCARLLKPKTHSTGLLQRFFGGFNRGFEAATGRYTALTRGLVRKSVLGIGLFLACLFSAGGLSTMVPTGFVPEEDQGYFFVDVRLPPPASLQRSDAVAREIDAILAETEGVKTYNTIVGYSILSSTVAPFNAGYFVQLKPWEERKGLDAGQIIRQLNARLSRIAAAQAFAMPPPAIPGIGTGGGFSFMLQAPGSATVSQLGETSKKFMQALNERAEIASAVTLFDADVPQIFVNVDREKMMRQGVSPTDVYSTLQTFMGGLYVNDFNRFGRQWRVYVSAEPEYRNRVEEIESFFIKNDQGKMVPLSSLTSPSPTSGPNLLTRFNLRRSAEILGQGAPGVASGRVLQVIDEVAQKELPEGWNVAYNNMSYQEKVAPPSGPVFALAVLFVFLILAAQYESWSLPFSVLLVVPAGVAGAMLALLLAKVPFDVYGQVGLIMLVGLSAKNAILIVEFAKVEYEKGLSATEAAISAAKLRLRPILMTAFAFILGCVPLLRASGAGAASRVSMGVVVVYGSLAATFIGIFLTPALFVLVQSVVEKVSGGRPPIPEGDSGSGHDAPHPGHAAVAQGEPA
jgi:hydrophobic/amphiphilic exporter-1 (mainly G- bacteria), HAE1 family